MVTILCYCDNIIVTLGAFWCFLAFADNEKLERNGIGFICMKKNTGHRHVCNQKYKVGKATRPTTTNVESIGRV